MTAEENRALNSQEIIDHRVVLKSLPVVVNIGMTSRCNINPPCVMCLRNNDPKGADISGKVLFKSGFIVPSASCVILHGVGEPLLHAQLFDITDMADPGAMVTFTTNGLLLDNYIDEVVATIGYLSISIDAGTPETYRKIRHNDLERVTGAIRKLVELKRLRKQATPIIDISMCLMRSNVTEMSRFVTMGSELGVDTVHFYHLNHGPEYDWKVGWFDYAQEHCRLDARLHDREVATALRLAKKLGVKVVFDGKRFFKRPIDFDFADVKTAPEPPPNDLLCIEPWRNLQINADGTTMNCCYQRWSLGDLNKERFDEIWNGANQRGIREGIIAGDLHVSCKDAPCPVNGRE